MGVIWHAWCLYFGVLGDPGTILGRSWDDPGTLGGTRKDRVRSRLGFYRFFFDLGDPFWKLLGHFWIKNNFVISISRLFFSDDFWVWIWVSGITKTSIWQWMYCKNQRSQKFDFLWFQGQFLFDFGWAWDQFSWLLLSWRLAWSRLEIVCFFRVARRDP